MQNCKSSACKVYDLGIKLVGDEGTIQEGIRASEGGNLDRLL